MLTILAVDDLAAAVAFYNAAFAWPIGVEVPVYVEYALPGGNRLGLYERVGFGHNTGQVPAKIDAGALAPTELYLHSDDIDAAIGRLRAAGARQLSDLAPRSWGEDVAYFADPCGNVIAIARPAAPTPDETGSAAPNPIVEVVSDKGKLCRTVLEALPDWFGIPEAIDHYVAEAEEMPMFAVLADGERVGFASVKKHFATAAEIYVMGILPAHHRRGLGRRLMAAVEDFARGEGVGFLTVKTLGPSRENAEYAGTRRFYQALGFQPVEEFPTLWGEKNPCLFLAKAL